MIWEFTSSDEIDATGLRRDVMRQIEGNAAPGSDFAAAELICGELIGNVIRHAPGPVTLTLFWDCEFPTLSVFDQGPPYTLHTELPVDPLSERGRGLYIVRCMARSLRFERHQNDDGTVVSVELPVTARASAPLS